MIADDAPRPDRPDLPRGGLWLIWAIILVCGVIEGALTLADWQVIDLPRLRRTVYEYAGFWPGLLDGWRPNYAGQPWAMFISYGFLHGDALHFGINMVTLWSLGRLVLERAGVLGFALIYGAAILGGALVYALMATSLAPMVGASGALFGLAGALVGYALAERVALRQSLWPVARAAALLVAINVVMFWALDGQLAWQTHLGGFLAGMLVAAFTRQA